MDGREIRELLKERGVIGDQIVAFANSEDENAEMKALTDRLAPKGAKISRWHLSSMAPRLKAK